jgi:hypothetical protein
VVVKYIRTLAKINNLNSKMKKGVERERGKVIVLHISVVSLYHGLFVAFLMDPT